MNKPRQYKYTSKFFATARCAVDIEQGKSLSIASINDLKSILPKDAGSNPDLLPIAANACVANIGNLWGDLVDTDIAKIIYPKFVHKYINLEHDRTQNVGFLTTAALSKFNSSYSLGLGSELLNPEDVTGFEPFNISVGGYIWRVSNQDLVDKLIEANDPDNPLYLKIAMSWELGFDDYILMVGSKERNYKDIELITDPAKIESLASNLKSKGGKNRLPDGRPVYRIITASYNEDGSVDENSVIPVGVGLTFTPAGAVTGIVTPAFQVEASLNEKNNQQIEKNNSQNTNGDVSIDITKHMKTLKSLKDLASVNDENVKEFSFANIANILEASEQSVASQVSAAVETAGKEWSQKVNAEKEAVASAQKEAGEAKKKSEEVAASLDEANKKIASLEKTQQEVLASQKFNERMSYFDEKYDLNDADRKALASRVKTLDDTAFTDFAENEFAVFAAAKKKGVNPFAKKEDAQDGGADDYEEDANGKKVKKVAKATAPVEDAAKIAIANAQAVANQTVVPNTPGAAEPTLKQKLANSFKLGEGVKFTK